MSTRTLSQKGPPEKSQNHKPKIHLIILLLTSYLNMTKTPKSQQVHFEKNFFPLIK